MGATVNIIFPDDPLLCENTAVLVVMLFRSLGFCRGLFGGSIQSLPSQSF
jgi:hypothetical protein